MTATLALLAACQPRPETAYDTARSRTAAVRNIGNFDEALRCIDDLFLAQGGRGIYITTAGIPDATGLFAGGTKEMFITAVSRTSAKANAFRFVDYDPTQLDLQVLSEAVGLRDDFVAPGYYVRGAIAQLDSNVLQSSASAGVSMPYMDLAINGDQVVSVDLNIGKLITRQILPGISASNSMAVARSGKRADVGGLIGKAGLSLIVSLDKSEGFHQAVRNLIELSTIEVLGKLIRVPYWRCLRIESTNPNFRAEGRGWFDTMGARERDSFVSAALVRTDYLRSEGAAETAQLFEAISRYQADNDLVPNGRVDFGLYHRMLAFQARRPEQVAATPVSPSGSASAGTSPPAASAASPSAPSRLVISTPRRLRPKYRIGETLVVAAEPGGDGYVYCCYEDAKGTVSRIFPNRFQADLFLHGGKREEIPPAARQSFTIRFDRPGGNEAVACMGSDREVGLRLPSRLKVQDFELLPVSGLDEVVTQFKAVPGARVDEQRLAVEVIL